MAGFDAHKNLAVSAVVTAPTPATSGTTLTVTAGEGARFPAPPFNATVWPVNAMPTPLTGEVIRVTGRTTDSLTIVRAQEGSTARTIGTGDLIAATITAKTLTDLETRAALKDEVNTFTASQTLQLAAPLVMLHDTTAPAEARVIDLVNYAQTLQFRALNDAATVELQALLILRRTGDLQVGRDLFEKQRTTPLGHPIAVPFNAGNFTTYPAGTWGVTAGNLKQYAYTLIGKTAIVLFILSDSTVTGGVTHLAISNPVPGAAAQVYGMAAAKVNAEVGIAYCNPGDPSIYINRPAGATFPASTGNIYFALTFFLP